MRTYMTCVLVGLALCLSGNVASGQHSTRDILAVETAIELAREAAKEDARFDDMSIISATLILPGKRSALLPKDLPEETRLIWTIEFSKHYPIAPGTRYFAEVTDAGKVFLRTLGR